MRNLTFVRTTYFDSDDHELFRSQRRRRVRLREYAGARRPDGIPALTGLCAFEVKESWDHPRRKARTAGDRAELMRLLRRGPGRPLDPDIARAAAQGKSGWLRPRLTTFFRRLSFTGPGIRADALLGLPETPRDSMLSWLRAPGSSPADSHELPRAHRVDSA